MMATVQQQTTQLEFHQAMADFKTMFPDMDDEVIEVSTYLGSLKSVLKKNRVCWETKHCFMLQWTS
jgi:hypothetical protein